MKQKLLPKMIKKYDALLLTNLDMEERTIIVLAYMKGKREADIKMFPFKTLTNDEAIEKMFEIVKEHKRSIYYKIKQYVIGDDKGYWHL